MTRRDIFDYLRSQRQPWCGRISEIDFLDRLYDLGVLPSTGRRHPNAGGDIVQHRIANHHWDDDWVFDDPRFRLASGPNEVLPGCLAQMAHPRLLAPDGWMLKPYKHPSGRPVYGPARTDTGGMAAVSFAHQAAARIDTEYVSQQVTRMEGAARPR